MTFSRRFTHRCVYFRKKDAKGGEHWKEIVMDGCGVEAQFCPCAKEMLAILSKEDFKWFGSNNICTILALEGEWLAHLLPLEKIEQEDFDNILVCCPEDYSCEEEFWGVGGGKIL